MAGNLIDTPQWQAVPYFESGAVLTGGPDCPDNIPIQALANRAAYLKAQIESALGGTAGMPGHLQAADPHPQYVKLTALLAELSALLSTSPPALTANGAEIISALWARSQLPSAGKNSEGLRVRRYLGVGIDPYSIVEDTDADFDTTGSANIPAGYAGYARLVVSRHSTTSIPAVPNGGYVYAEYKIHSLYDSREWKSVCTTNQTTGVKTYTPWELAGGGGGSSYTGTDWSDVTSARLLQTTYWNTSTTNNLEVIVEFFETGGSPLEMKPYVNGVTLPSFWSDVYSRRPTVHFTVPPGGSYGVNNAVSTANITKWVQRFL
jgi:hypothetical protein